MLWLRQYGTRILGTLIGLLVGGSLGLYYFFFAQIDCWFECSPEEARRVFWSALVIGISITAFAALMGWAYVSRAIDLLLRIIRWFFRALRQERQTVQQEGRTTRAAVVLLLVAVLVVFQAAFLSVVIDAVDPSYLQSDRYHITADYLISISELLLAGAIAIQAGNMLGRLPFFRSSLTTYLAGFILCFVAAAAVIDDIRDAGVDYILAERSTEDRRFAALVAINQMALVQQGLDFEEADLGIEELATPDAKITLFLSPVIFYLAGLESLEATSDEKVEALLRTVDEEGIVRRIQEAADRETAEYCAFFEQMYADYTGSVNGAVDKIAEVSRSGIGSARAYEEASRFYFNMVNQKLGRGWAVLPGLTREQFINHRDVQKAIKGRIQKTLPAMRERVAESEFPVAGARAVSAFEDIIRRKDIYVDPCEMNERIVRGVSSDIRGQLWQDVRRALDPERTTLGVGGEHERYGRTALEIAILPTFSIAALLFGMVLNGRGVIGQFTGRVLGLPPGVGSTLALLFIGFAVLWPLSQPHEQLDEGAIADLMVAVQEERGVFTRYGIEWIVRGASGLYDAGTRIRDTLDFSMMGLENHIAEHLESRDLGPGLGPEGLTAR
ncbi:hypothetical protein [Rhodovulum sulfidophilum]|uniref:MotA/TolQ/ExbB proton channel domain-containing protein n=1 Tax=Rhodovulum sulfidophilum TaxID=35806 RepID=A0ABS1S1X0_RHOSU|nr:hypothetical protein [Rhodovulum sulfidophilum]MBL3611184.1 hypothetical protein [Rhodovulum sulfidophilum]MCE8455727.1 hypothetical protein [Rhodovulum sulfidophilum]